MEQRAAVLGEIFARDEAVAARVYLADVLGDALAVAVPADVRGPCGGKPRGVGDGRVATVAEVQQITTEGILVACHVLAARSVARLAGDAQLRHL